MCSADEHKAIVSRNLEFIGFVSERRPEAAKFNEWLCVAYFYCAIHDCESYLANNEIHYTVHREREEVIRDIQRDPKLCSMSKRKLFDSYFSLKNICNRARYHGIIMKQEDLDESKSNYYEFASQTSNLLPIYLNGLSANN